MFAQTEALVAIDVNSGRATKERHIEETAYKTNIEAADEIARQLRLRDLAGLVVIDFIDMEDNRNNHAVERRLKEALKADRARIQVGRISHFGLLELSRQRLRPSLIEANYRPCAHCAGSGMVRSTESAAVYALRMMEEEGVRQRSSEITVTVHPDVALYLLNYKRDSLAGIESRTGMRIFVLGDATLVPPNIRLDRVKATTRDDSAELPPPREHREIEHHRPAPVEVADEDDADTVEEAPEPRDNNRPQQDSQSSGPRDDAGGRKRRRRRRRGRGGEGRNEGAPNGSTGEFAGAGDTAQADEGASEQNEAQAEGGEAQGEQGPGGPRDDQARRGRRRGRRGGRRRRRGGEPQPGENQPGEHQGEQHGEHQHGGEANGSASAESHQHTQQNDAPAAQHNTAAASADTSADASSNGERSPSRGFFQTLKESVPWRRNEGAGETQSEAAPSAPAPAATPAPAPAPTPVAAPAPAPAPVSQTAPSAAEPSRKGWWDEKA